MTYIPVCEISVRHAKPHHDRVVQGVNDTALAIRAEGSSAWSHHVGHFGISSHVEGVAGFQIYHIVGIVEEYHLWLVEGYLHLVGAIVTDGCYDGLFFQRHIIIYEGSDLPSFEQWQVVANACTHHSGVTMPFGPEPRHIQIPRIVVDGLT